MRGKIIVSLLNQFVTSGTNFIFSYYLIRSLSQEVFGLYGICYATILLIAGVLNALITTQLIVYYHEKNDKIHEYISKMFYLGVLLSIAILLVLSIPSFITDNLIVELLPLVVISTGFYFLRDFTVRLSYIQNKEIHALIINFSACISLFIAVLITSFDDLLSALWYLTISQLVALIVGIYCSRGNFTKVDFNELVTTFLEIFDLGKWGCGTDIILWLRSHSYIYIVTGLAGSSGVAIVNAAKMLVTPAVILMPALSQLLMPHMARLAIKSKVQLIKTTWFVTLVYIGIAILYSFLLLFFNQEIIDLLYPDDYKNIETLLYAWSLYLIFYAAVETLRIYMQVTKQFKMIFYINIYLAFLLMLCVYVGYVMLKVEGIVIGLMVIEAIFFVILFGIFLKQNGLIY
ncbi:lipopolysaccharide biosynthesis protein [Endozoicomonas sp. YOMI1]|uniref:lipopolysaccharide biosynthesis protein n=1 Tax=Endozoicomonas sp. YOMI1 TaxID=2828739 RepID=UPI0021479BD6|nr:lipopolysaccharide biosynthesis protein [Endozoicomonas sp. YOMI1]